MNCETAIDKSRMRGIPNISIKSKLTLKITAISITKTKRISSVMNKLPVTSFVHPVMTIPMLLVWLNNIYESVPLIQLTNKKNVMAYQNAAITQDIGSGRCMNCKKM